MFSLTLFASSDSITAELPDKSIFCFPFRNQDKLCCFFDRSHRGMRLPQMQGSLCCYFQFFLSLNNFCWQKEIESDFSWSFDDFLKFQSAQGGRKWKKSNATHSVHSTRVTISWQTNITVRNAFELPPRKILFPAFRWITSMNLPRIPKCWSKAVRFLRRDLQDVLSSDRMPLHIRMHVAFGAGKKDVNSHPFVGWFCTIDLFKKNK